MVTGACLLGRCEPTFIVQAGEQQVPDYLWLGRKTEGSRESESEKGKHVACHGFYRVLSNAGVPTGLRRGAPGVPRRHRGKNLCYAWRMKLKVLLSVLFLLPFGKPANALQIIYDDFTAVQTAGTSSLFGSNTIRTLGSFPSQATATISADKFAVSDTGVPIALTLLTYTFFVPQDYIGYELQLAGLDVTSGSFNTNGLTFVLEDNSSTTMSVIPTISGFAGDLIATVPLDPAIFATLNLTQITRFSFDFSSSSSFNLTASDVQFQRPDSPPEAPEPSTYLLVLAGSLALFAYKRQAFKSSRAITPCKLHT